MHANVLLLLVPALSLDDLRLLMRNARHAAEDDSNQHQLGEECHLIDSWGGINWCQRCLWRLGQAPEHHCAREVAGGSAGTASSRAVAKPTGLTHVEGQYQEGDPVDSRFQSGRRNV